MKRINILLIVLIILLSYIHFSLNSEFAVLQLRLSIYLQEITVAFTLSMGGMILQTLLLNPLAEPYILGVSSSSSFGAVLSLFFALSPILIFRTIFALIGSITITAFIFYISRSKYSFSIGLALLSGVSLNAFFSALIILFQSLLIPNDWAASIRWIMGNIDYVSYPELFLLITAMVMELLFILFYYKELNIYMTGEEMALSVGVDVRKLKLLGFITVSASTALITSVVGMLGFIGLVVPQMIKLHFHLDHKLSLLPVFLLSSIFLVGAGIIAKNALNGTSLPIGVVNSLISSPFFIYVLIKNYKGL